MVAVQTQQSPALGYLRVLQGDIFYPASPETAGEAFRGIWGAETTGPRVRIIAKLRREIRRID